MRSSWNWFWTRWVGHRAASQTSIQILVICFVWFFNFLYKNLKDLKDLNWRSRVLVSSCLVLIKMIRLYCASTHERHCRCHNGGWWENSFWSSKSLWILKYSFQNNFYFPQTRINRQSFFIFSMYIQAELV
jgi:hypothetical protein